MVCRIHHNGTRIWHDKDQRIHREDGPAVIYVDGNKVWYQHGKRHRVDGPAIEFVNGYKVWYQHGKRHRIDGPAVIHVSGRKEYWIRGGNYTEKEWKKYNGMYD